MGAGGKAPGQRAAPRGVCGDALGRPGGGVWVHSPMPGETPRGPSRTGPVLGVVAPRLPELGSRQHRGSASVGEEGHAAGCTRVASGASFCRDLHTDALEVSETSDAPGGFRNCVPGVRVTPGAPYLAILYVDVLLVREFRATTRQLRDREASDVETASRVRTDAVRQHAPPARASMGRAAAILQRAERIAALEGGRADAYTSDRDIIVASRRRAGGDLQRRLARMTGTRGQEAPCA